MTLKPPTRTLPRLVMKDWPQISWQPAIYSAERGITILTSIEQVKAVCAAYQADKTLSDFTRVGEGVQGRPQKEGSRDE